MTRPAHSNGSDRSRQILKVASRLFRQRGYVAVGVDDIGAAVGFSGPAVYRYFESKQAILEAIVCGYLERLATDWRAAQSAAPPVRDDRTIQVAVLAAIRDPDGIFALTRFAPLLSRDARDRATATRRSFPGDWDTLVPAVDGESLQPIDRLRMRAAAGVLLHTALTRRETKAYRTDFAHEALGTVAHLPLSAIGGAPVSPRPAGTGLIPVTRREALLAAATELMGQRGYASVSLGDIGARVGITASAVVRHFESKEEVLAAAIGRASEQVAGSIAMALRQSVGPAAALERVVSSYTDFAAESRDVMALLTIETYSLSTTAREARRKRHQMYIDELAHLIGQTCPDQPIAWRRLRAGATFALINEVILGNAIDTADVDNLRSLALAVATSRGSVAAAAI